MAKTRKRSRIRRVFTRVYSRAKKTTIPIAIVAGLAPGATAVVTTAQSAGWMNAGRMMGTIYTGYDYTTGKWSLSNTRVGLMPLVAGFAIHKVAGMLGINKSIAAAGIPFFRI